MRCPSSDGMDLRYFRSRPAFGELGDLSALALPSSSASSMNWPETPNTSDNTLPNLTFASRTFCPRLRSAVSCFQQLLAYFPGLDPSMFALSAFYSLSKCMPGGSTDSGSDPPTY